MAGVGAKLQQFFPMQSPEKLIHKKWVALRLVLHECCQGENVLRGAIDRIGDQLAEVLLGEGTEGNGVNGNVRFLQSL